MTEKILSERREDSFILNRVVCTHIHVSVCMCVSINVFLKVTWGPG